MKKFPCGEGHGNGYQHKNTGFGDGIGYGDICGGGYAAGLFYQHGNGVSLSGYDPVTIWESGNSHDGYPYVLIQFWSYEK